MAKRKALSFELKLQVIECLEKGEKQIDVCRKWDLAGSTVRGIWNSKEKIKSYCDNNKKLKRMRTAAYDELLDQALLGWFRKKQRYSNTPISGRILLAKALQLAEPMNLDFKCTSSWIKRFKKRHNIVFGANAENAEEKQKQQMLRNIELSYPPVDSQFLTEDSNPSQTSESEPIASTSKLATLTSATVKPATVTSATVTSQVSQPKSLIQKSTVAEFSVIKKSTVDETAKLRETIKRLEEKNIQLQVENESYRVKNIMLETKQKKLIVQLKTIIQKKDPLYLGDSRLVYEQHSQRLTVSSASTTGSRTTTTLAGQGHDSDVGATQSQDFSDPDDPTDNTAFMDSLQPSDIDIDVGPIFETIEIKPNIELDNLPPPPPSPPPKRKRTAIPDIEVAEQEDPLATKRTRSSPLVGYGEDGDKEDDDNFSGDEFDEEEDGDKVRRAYQLLKSVFDKKDKYDIFGHRLAARLRALKSAKVCRHVLDIMESVIDDAEAGKYNNV
ncbi:uncharacterized protein LOC111046939 isoform X16 [Nilaparvata lugens]|uniref:uncharacterized protein LOC111046939 isoform X16 n=1 Tax=Nilaparvata lugens TaxID=108931 RepID=UPI00193CA7A4|nr:uncharacterized protein LOC111046939 isoform X16 [Nilaparvata lugens]